MRLSKRMEVEAGISGIIPQAAGNPDLQKYYKIGADEVFTQHTFLCVWD